MMQRLGLVNKVFSETDFESGVDEYARGYSTVSRSAVMMSKRLLYEMDTLDFAVSMELGAKANAAARMTEDCKAGIARFLEKT